MRRGGFGFGFGFGAGFSGAAAGPEPAIGSFVPLSWIGPKVGAYDFDVAAATPNTYNTVNRDGSVTGFDSIMLSDETVLDTEVFVYLGDFRTNNNTGVWLAFGLDGVFGSGFADLEFALRADMDGAVINWEWWESGTKIADLTTTTKGDCTAWRIEYDGANGIEVYVDGILEISRTSTFSGDTLAMKVLGRDPNGQVSDHFAMRTKATPNKSWVPFGDGITFGRAVSGLAGGSWVAKTISFTDHNIFVNPVLALGGDTTAMLITDQLPRASDYFQIGYTANIASVMIGINDVRTAVPIATIRANLNTIVTDLQTAGYTVVQHTILRDFGTAWADRITLNNEIIANDFGADFVINHTTSPIETDSGLFEVDQYHPNPDGMSQVALDSWLVYDSF